MTVLKILSFPSPNDGSKPCGPLVREVSRLFLSDRERRFKRGLLSLEFLRRYKRTWKAFVRSFGDREAESLKASDLENWILAKKKWKSGHTRRNVACEVLAGLHWADDELLIRNPIRRFRPDWDPPQPREAISAAEYQGILDLLKQCRGRKFGCKRRCPGRSVFRLAMIFLWETGARTKEMRDARWQDLDWRTGIIVLNRHKTSRKTGEERLIPLGDRILRLLGWVFKKRRPRPSDAIFLSSRRGVWTQRSFADQFRFFADQVGVRDSVSPYSLRHGFTVQGLEAGIGERQLADVLGHTSTRYVAWYGKKAKSNTDYLRGILAQIRARTKH